MMMMMSPISVRIWIAGTLLILELCLSTDAALKEYDGCKHNGKPGICRGYSYCRNQLQNQRITICSYNSQEAVVCCPESEGFRIDDNDASSSFPDSSSGVTVKNVRKAVEKCNEYRKLSYNRIAISTLTLTPTVVSFEVPKCDNIVKLIVGGNLTKPGEFPHMAAIGWRRGNTESFDCGGSLISDRFVLTAAHCYVELDGVFPTFVRLGDQNLVRQDDGAHPKDVDIDTYMRHPNFKRREGHYNDIALIKLVESVRFTNFIRPACLYDREQTSSDQAIATGFGLTEDHGDKSDELLKVSLNIYDNEVCGRGYVNSRQLKKGIMRSQLCAGNVLGGQDTCQGDSGGPLQITKQENHCVFYILGITSFGQTCGSTVPAIYTRVASYLDWIEPIVWG
ncbi:venom protease-like [Malaya genurostris]|uniref:venom protease-like n=1 Tax=Malaya genurostris TaxID=325434 RepID=UPI0026F3B8C6|nr:venom protease-like [Malaya genurostris]